MSQQKMRDFKGSVSEKRFRRGRLLSVVVPFVLAVVVLAIIAFIWLGQGGKGTNEVLLSPYQYENQSLSDPVIEIESPALFAESLCTVPDESVYASEYMDTGAAIMCDVTNRQVVFSQQAFERMYPASTTKLMTLLVALKYGNLDDLVTVTEDTFTNLVAGSSLCNIHTGDQITLRDLLYGLMIPSGNDAAAAIAIHMSGSEAAFAELMTKEAKALGATGSNFVNPHGLHYDNHYTTAYDLYLIFNELLNYDLFLQIIAAPSYTASYTNAAGEQVVQTWNPTNWYLTGAAVAPSSVTVLGGKTGTETLAKYCLTLASEDSNGNRYISVVLRSPTRDQLYTNMTSLLTRVAN